MKNLIPFAATWSLLFAVSVNAIPTTFYDIDFSSPTHTVGSAPQVGVGTDRPSSIVFGQPLVEKSLGGLTEQPLVFNAEDGGPGPAFFYDQIQLNLGRGASNYQTSFSFSSTNFVGTGSVNHFVLLFDTPSVQTVDFLNDGTILVNNQAVASFHDDELLRLYIDVDLNTRIWKLFMNDSSRFSGPFFPVSDDILDVRFSFGNVSAGFATTSDSVGLDNLRIATDSVRLPEPSVVELGFAALLAVYWLRRVATS